MSTSLASLVSDIRIMSGLMSNQLYTDAEIAAMAADCWKDLYDRFVSANQHYRVKTFEFTLAGNTQGDNAVDLPSDFQLGNGLELNPSFPRPYSVSYLSSWLNRNNLGASVLGNSFACPDGRQYCFNDGQLIVYPADRSSGDYKLYYTPMAETLLAESTQSWDIGTSAARFIGRDIDIEAGDNVDVATKTWTFANGRFVDAGTTAGNLLGISSPGNSGSWTVLTVLSNTQIVTFETPIVDEDFTVSDSADCDDVIEFAFPTAEFTQDMVGGELVIDFDTSAPPDNAGYNGTFEIFSVISSTLLAIVLNNPAAPSITGPSGGSITANWQVPGTTDTLPNIADPWALYVKVCTCLTIREARGQEVTDMQRRYQEQAQRVDKALQNRQEEATQPPLTRDRGFWDTL